MQPSVYLQSSDYAVYGVAASTTPTDVISASQLIDAYLQRDEGLLYDATSKTMLKTDAPIVETLRIPHHRRIIFSRFPVVEILEISHFNGAQRVILTDRSGADLLAESGDYVVPNSLPTRCPVTFKYVAGFPDYAHLPIAVRHACANVINNTVANCELSGNIKMQKAGDAQLERFHDSIFDSDTKYLLNAYIRVGIF